jgi:calcineurin-binding protein cabin-1
MSLKCFSSYSLTCYRYILRYIHILQRELQLDQLESVHETIKKCMNNPEFCNNNLTEVSKHASLSWCWCLLMELASITPVPETAVTNDKWATSSGNGIMLYADLQSDELLMTSPIGRAASKYLDTNWSETLSRISNLQIRKVPAEKTEEAVNLMRSSYNFYRQGIHGTLPSGIKLYTVSDSPASSSFEGQVEEPVKAVRNIHLAIPEKFLLWAYALVSGQYCNISAVVEYCQRKKV